MLQSTHEEKSEQQPFNSSAKQVEASWVAESLQARGIQCGTVRRTVDGGDRIGEIRGLYTVLMYFGAY